MKAEPLNIRDKRFLINRLIEQALGSESVRDVADRLSAQHKLPRRQIYARALEISRAREGGG